MARLKTAVKELAILDAASRVFAARPFHEVLIDNIAADAGIGKGTIYRYFQTKEDLYFAAILHVIDSLTSELEATLAGEASAWRRLEAIASVILRHFWDRKQLLPFFQREEHFPMGSDELGTRRERILGLVQETIRQGVERGELRRMDPRIGANLFLGMVRSMNLFHRSDDRLDELVAQLVGVFRSGVARADA